MFNHIRIILTQLFCKHNFELERIYLVDRERWGTYIRTGEGLFKCKHCGKIRRRYIWLEDEW